MILTRPKSSWEVRAEEAERALEVERLAHQETRGTVAALKQKIREMGQSTDRDELIDDLQRLREGLVTLEREMVTVLENNNQGRLWQGSIRRWVHKLQSLLTQTHVEEKP